MTENPIISYGVMFALAIRQSDNVQIKVISRTEKRVCKREPYVDEPVKRPELWPVQVADSRIRRAKGLGPTDRLSDRTFNTPEKAKESHRQLQEPHRHEQIATPRGKGKTEGDKTEQQPEVQSKDNRFSKQPLETFCEVTLTVYPKNGATDVAFYFNSQSEFLDLVRGASPPKHSLLDGTSKKERKDSLDDVDQAVATAILGGKNNFVLRPCMPGPSARSGMSNRPAVEILINRTTGKRAQKSIYRAAETF